MKKELRTFWTRIFDFNWKFGLFLILLICVPRFFLVLRANATQNYTYIGLIMIFSALIPFIFLTKYGLRKIGITKPQSYKWVLVAFITGFLISIIIYFIGQIFYGDSYENWYNYIGRSYNIPQGISERDKFIYFIITAATGMIFSPIGEEFFFRGVVHTSFANSLGEKKASLADSSAFALTHVSHFGLVFINNQWKFLFVPALIWVFFMFTVSILFFLLKSRSGSLIGAISCHAAFNLGMILSIFYFM